MTIQHKAGALLAAALTLTTPLLSQSAHAADDKVVYFYNWSEYVPDGLLEQFQQETGIKVIYSTYESNETLYAKLKTHGDGYDVVVPSTYFISKMAKEGMLQPLDRAQLPNFKHLDPTLLNHEYDPDNRYSIPKEGMLQPGSAPTPISSNSRLPAGSSSGHLSGKRACC